MHSVSFRGQLLFLGLKVWLRLRLFPLGVAHYLRPVCRGEGAISVAMHDPGLLVFSGVAMARRFYRIVGR